jgi:hypothetical protein
MSRKHVTPHHASGELRLLCPYLHPVGSLVLNPGGRFVMLTAGAPLDRVHDAPATRIEDGEKVHVQCQVCKRDGRRPDYQASYASVVGPLTRNLADHTVAAEDFIVGA